LLGLVDALTATLSARYSKHLVCRAGCSGCCHHHLSVFAVEAAALRETIAELSPEVRERIAEQSRKVDERELRGEAVACPLLVDDRCAVYQSRPLICRTQGLPLLLEAEDGTQEVDFCPLNFTAPDAVNDLEENQLVPLDALNLKLAVVNIQYCQENGIERADSGRRRKMSEIILDGASENQ
jgi:Fe-S-cluster containining protein